MAPELSLDLGHGSHSLESLGVPGWGLSSSMRGEIDDRGDLRAGDAAQALTPAQILVSAGAPGNTWPWAVSISTALSRLRQRDRAPRTSPGGRDPVRVDQLLQELGREPPARFQGRVEWGIRLGCGDLDPKDEPAAVRHGCEDRGVAKTGRNEPCSCGSGRKSKRCCGVPRGPVEDELARAFVAAEALAAAPWLARLADDEFEVLWDELLELPGRDLSLHFPLPRLVAPELHRLIEAIGDDDADAADDALEDALDRLDTAVARAVLARAVIALRDTRRLAPRLAAVAIIDLAGRSRALIRASLVEAAAVAAGTVRTPGGLVVVSKLAA